jgi:hypothetical protein
MFLRYMKLKIPYHSNVNHSIMNKINIQYISNFLLINYKNNDANYVYSRLKTSQNQRGITKINQT